MSQFMTEMPFLTWTYIHVLPLRIRKRLELRRPVRIIMHFYIIKGIARTVFELFFYTVRYSGLVNLCPPV